MPNMQAHDIITAGLLVIGDEILSGRTKDKNIGYIAEYLTAVGIDLMEVRVVGDEEASIVDALNALRHRYTSGFTTGGIGPTHDHITADCVAKAFGVSIDVDPRALAIMQERLGATGTGMSEPPIALTRKSSQAPRARWRTCCSGCGARNRAAADSPAVLPRMPP